MTRLNPLGRKILACGKISLPGTESPFGPAGFRMDAKIAGRTALKDDRY
jgi:hypothetical protein